jgi:hypothetical protein
MTQFSVDQIGSLIERSLELKSVWNLVIRWKKRFNLVLNALLGD